MPGDHADGGGYVGRPAVTFSYTVGVDDGGGDGMKSQYTSANACYSVVMGRRWLCAKTVGPCFCSGA